MMMAHASAGAGAATGPDAQPGTEGAGDPLPTLIQALQIGYGLKLEAKKNPADFLIVDHAEKVPTEN
jgi:uncharacterized protein (TIGR03435 family)